MSESDWPQIDELIFRALKGVATPAEEAELMRWRMRSPENEAHYAQLAAMLRATDSVEAMRERSEPPMADITRAQPVVIEFPMSAGRAMRRRPRLGFSAGMLAAAMVIAIGLIFFQPFRNQQLVLAAAEYITSDSETAVVRLGDGSVVRLAPNSRLAVLPSTDVRQVRLDGRAFFAVSENRDIPFLVETTSGRTKVLGTRFDVEASEQETRVIVVQGRVELATSAGEVELNANEVSVVRRDEVPGKSHVRDVQRLLNWLDTFVVFQETALTDVANEIESRFGIAVRITDPSLEQQTVTGWSISRTPADILTRVCPAVHARCEVSDTLVLIQPKF